MIFWSYYLCVTTDPGRVPDKWVRSRSFSSPPSSILAFESKLTSLPSSSPSLPSPFHRSPTPDEKIWKSRSSQEDLATAPSVQPTNHQEVCSAALSLRRSFATASRAHVSFFSSFSSSSSLQDLQSMHSQDGPSLPMDSKLHRTSQLRVLRPIPHLRRHLLFVRPLSISCSHL